MFIIRIITIGLFSFTQLFTADTNTIIDLKLFATLPRELHAFCIPDFEDILSGAYEKSTFMSTEYFVVLKSKNYHKYGKNTGGWKALQFKKAKNDLLIVSLQLLQHGITMTYKRYPYVALCIYKQCHKNKERFEAIASGLISNISWATPIIGDALLKVLGTTVYEKMKPYKQVKSRIVEDFKNLLYKKNTCFLFPTQQVAFKNEADFKRECTEAKKSTYQESMLSDIKNNGKSWQWYYALSEFFIFKPFQHNSALRSRFGNPLIALKRELMYQYEREGRFINHPWSENVGAVVYFDGAQQKFTILKDVWKNTELESTLDMEFKAEYQIPALTQKDRLIHALLYRYVKKIDTRSRTFYARLCRMADTDLTRLTTSTIHTDDNCNLWEYIQSYIPNIYNWYSKTNTIVDIPPLSCMNTVLLYDHSRYSVYPDFWYKHNKHAQKKNPGYRNFLSGNFLKTLIYEEEQQ